MGNVAGMGPARSPIFDEVEVYQRFPALFATVSAFSLAMDKGIVMPDAHEPLVKLPDSVPPLPTVNAPCGTYTISMANTLMSTTALSATPFAP